MWIFSKELQITGQLLGKAPGTVCFVGGGGKTTLMYTLARHRAKLGQKVLVGTTTRILIPPRFYAADEQQAKALWAQGQPAVIGTPCGEKLTANPELLARLRTQADITLLEADGAKGHPCKVPAAWEPVIDAECDWVVAVFGISAIGRPLQEVCFRLTDATALLDVPADHILTPLDAARMLASPNGGRKAVGNRRWCAVLNQCDDKLRRTYAEETARYLEEMGEENVIMTAFDEQEREQWMEI